MKKLFVEPEEESMLLTQSIKGDINDNFH